jgi:hypothetical protein
MASKIPGVAQIVVPAVILTTTALTVTGLHPGRAMADEPGCQVGPADPQQAWAQGPQTITVAVDLDPRVFAAVQEAFTTM